MNSAAVELRQHIQAKVIEKRKALSAKNNLIWFLMAANGLVLATFLKVVAISQQPTTTPWPAYLTLVTLVAIVGTLLFVKNYLLQSELTIASAGLMLATTFSLLAILTLLAGLKITADATATIQVGVIALGFFTVNVVIASIYTGVALAKTRQYKIHSMNMTLFLNIARYWIFILVAYVSLFFVLYS